jgi:spermidine synthase
VPLFTTTLFVSALLLFLVQPMVAKMVLPILGGAPTVWNVCMVFFQLTLLAGYAYAHGSTKCLRPRAQMLCHALLLLVPFAVLPVMIQRDSVSVAQDHQALWLIALLAGSIGLPFLVLSTSASVLQHWFSRTDHPAAGDPYFLYTASNLGSFAALAAYPTVIEPLLSLRDQSRFWGAGYGLFVALVIVCAWVAWRHAGMKARESALTDTHRALDVQRIGMGRRGRWVALAFIPSSLMLGVTTYLSTDVAAVPLFWVVPLALYLATFMVAFSSKGEGARQSAARFFPILVLPVTLLLCARAWSSLVLVFPLHLATFVAASLICHGELAADRPDRSYLTEFYLWISFGGVLGGVFNSLIAPLVFKGVAEYPIALVLACFCLPMAAAPKQTSAGVHTTWLADIAVLLGSAALAMVAVLELGRPDELRLLVALLAIPSLFAFSQRRHRVRFALTLGGLLFGALWFGNTGETLLHAERTFFGVYRVNVDVDGRFRELMHGTTTHGKEAVAGPLRGEPMTYFHRSGPFGQAWGELPRAASASNVAVMGLGVGSLAAYAGPAQHWTFFEIDPAVERIARDSSYFTFLDRCGERCRVVIGDARLSLEHASGQPFDLMVLDVFSSDAVPIHLLTSEAFALYVSRLARGGALLVNISNRHLSLNPIVARIAENAGLVAFMNFDRAQPDWPEGRSESRWVALARRPEDLGQLVSDSRWIRLHAPASTRLWTDDFSNVLSAIVSR